MNRPGTLADALESLGRRGINVEGAFGYPTGETGVLHVLVEDDAAARAALEASGHEVTLERDVVLVGPLANEPGEGARLARRIADQGINIDTVYLTMDGGVVLSGEDVPAIERVVSG